ncbi:MAG: hypothetical protein Q4B73_07910 [Lachnospiraceae bacterium]|nr:hypothetical protein [Lachnospiraceae bacterium]
MDDGNMLIAAMGTWTAVFCDLENGKIPNSLIIFMAAASLLRGVRGPLAILLVCLVLWPLFRLRLAGAGDIKLMAVLAGLLGLVPAGRVGVAALFIGGLLGLALLMTEGGCAQFLKLGRFARLCLMTRTAGHYDKTGARQLPMSLPIFMGVLLVTGGVI